jgi:hypothetical protein
MKKKQINTLSAANKQIILMLSSTGIAGAIPKIVAQALFAKRYVRVKGKKCANFFDAFMVYKGGTG